MKTATLVRKLEALTLPDPTDERWVENAELFREAARQLTEGAKFDGVDDFVKAQQARAVGAALAFVLQRVLAERTPLEELNLFEVLDYALTPEKGH